MSDEQAVLTEKKGRVLLITLNRPEAMNSINGALATGLADAVNTLNTDDGLTAAVLTGTGKGFSAGMDLKAFSRGEDMSGLFGFVQGSAEKPLIAAVEGFALAGGLELALTCDLIVASKGAKFGIPEVKVGLFAAAGGLMRLPTRVGHGKAMEMALTGDPIPAEEAHQYGLVARLTEPGEAVTGAMELAEKIAGNAPLGVAASAKLIKESNGRTEAEFWEYQGPLQGKVFTSNDAKEGPKAFAEKRAPKWTGS